MKKIVISGYYGFGNTGDEAILSGILKNLRDEAVRTGEEFQFTVLSADPSQTSRDYGVSAVLRTGLKDIFKTVCNCHLFISGGGGLLQDVTGRQFSIFYYLGLALLAKLCRKKVSIYAQGMGPINSRFKRWFTAKALDRMDLIMVREEDSRQLLKEIGVKKEVLVTADPAFLLDKPAAEGKSFPTMGVSVHPRCTEQDLKVLAGALDFMVEKYGFRVMLIPFYPAQDLQPSRQVQKGMKTFAELVSSPGKVPEVLEKIGGLDILIGARLHSLIFAAMWGVPFAGISYDPKIDIFIKNCGLSAAGSAGSLQENKLIEIIEDLWNNRREVRKLLESRVPEFKKAAGLNGSLTLDLIKKQLG